MSTASELTMSLGAGTASNDVTNNTTVPITGFNFENVQRNAIVEQLASNSGVSLPNAKKTGTTIVGMTFDGGVVLGADTRATGGSEVAEKNCTKIHYIAPNIYCCGAGTAADTEKTTALISSQLELLRMDTHMDTRVVTAVTRLKRMLYRYQGYISAALVLGGVDSTGPHIYQIYPHGSTGRLPYTTMGSGSLAAMAMFESMWQPGMNEAEAIALVKRSIGAGIFNDLGSGGSCDLCIIRTDGTIEYIKKAVAENDVVPLRTSIQRSSRLTMTPGLTPVIKESYTPHPAKSNLTLVNDSNVTEMEVDA